MALALYFGTGYLTGQQFFDIPAGSHDPRILVFVGIAAVVFYAITVFWLSANDTILGTEKWLWLGSPWVVFVVGFVCFLLIR
jgi:hypothetical protein